MVAHKEVELTPDIPKVQAMWKSLIVSTESIKGREQREKIDMSFGHFWPFLDPKIAVWFLTTLTTTHAHTPVWATPTLCLLWTKLREAGGLFWIWKQVSNTLSMISAQSS